MAIYFAANNIETYPVFFHILTKYGLHRQILIEVRNIKVRGNPAGGNRADTCGQTDGHEEVNGRFSQLCERA
jgi:hypothetical protein